MAVTIEKWKEVELDSLGGRYLISTFGRVKRSDSGQFVSQVLTGKPAYFYVNLRNADGTRILRRVHNLVARTFIPNPDNLKMVDHEDRNKYNNCLDNLRWASRKDNQRNRDVTIMVGDAPLAQVLEEELGDEYSLYLTSFTSSLRRGETYESRLGRFRDAESRGGYYTAGLLVNEMEENTYDFCKKNNLDYKQTLVRINRGYSTQELLSGSKEYTGSGYNVHMHRSYSDGCGYWYPTLKSITRHLGISHTAITSCKGHVLGLTEGLEEHYCNTHNIKEFNINGKMYKTTFQELCTLFNTSEGRVETYMQRYGDTLEDALQKPLTRIIKHEINGEVKRNKVWFEHFNIPTIKANSKLSKCKDFRKTLEHFGVDTSSMTISPYI